MTNWNIGKTFNLEEYLKINAKIGGSLNNDLPFRNQHYGEMVFSYSVNDSISLYGKYRHQIDPIQTNQFVLGVKRQF